MNGKDVKFTVIRETASKKDPNKKVILNKTIARIDGCEADVQNYIMKKTCGIEVPLELCGLKGCFKASVKLQEGDAWNEEEGKREAARKLKDKYVKAFNKALIKTQNYVNAQAAALNELKGIKLKGIE